MFRGSETVISRIFNFVRKALLHSTAAMYLREHCSWLCIFFETKGSSGFTGGINIKIRCEQFYQTYMAR